MSDEVSAASMVACFNNNPPQVRGRTVYVQFSNHRELKTDQSHSIAVSIKQKFFFIDVCCDFEKLFLKIYNFFLIITSQIRNFYNFRLHQQHYNNKIFKINHQVLVHHYQSQAQIQIHRVF